MQNRKIYQVPENGKEVDKKIEVQVQQTLLNMLRERGVLTDKVCLLAMSKVAEGV